MSAYNLSAVSLAFLATFLAFRATDLGNATPPAPTMSSAMMATPHDETAGTAPLPGMPLFLWSNYDRPRSDRHSAQKVFALIVLKCSRQEWRRHGRAISQKHLDFVLCEPKTNRIVAAIELDDRSHDNDKSREKDAFKDEALATAGILLIRVNNARNYGASDIKDTILSALRMKPAA